MNEYGSYTCECLAGFLPTYSSEFKCEDYDECSDNCANDCDHEHSICHNLIGSFECSCKPGLIGNGKQGNCSDINECLSNSGNTCSENAICVNFFGGYECKCRTGFGGDGINCQDINECVDYGFEMECQQKHSTCLNTIGSYECQCLPGFYLDTTTTDHTCLDVDECKSGQVVCAAADNAVCINTAGGYSCECAAGFSWSALNQICLDINECVVESGRANSLHAASVCDENSICVNTIGSYSCECKAGWNRSSSMDYCTG